MPIPDINYRDLTGAQITECFRAGGAYHRAIRNGNVYHLVRLGHVGQAFGTLYAGASTNNMRARKRAFNKRLREIAAD